MLKTNARSHELGYGNHADQKDAALITCKFQLVGLSVPFTLPVVPREGERMQPKNRLSVLVGQWFRPAERRFQTAG